MSEPSEVHSGAARIPPLKMLDDEQTAIVAKTVLDNGPPLNIFATMVRHRRLAKRVNVLAGLFLSSQHVPVRDRELIILRTAYRSGSEYEFAHHVPIARAVGFGDAEFSRLRGAALAGWKDDDRFLVQLADELHETADVSDATWHVLSQRHSDEAIMELVLLGGFYRAMGAFMNAIRVQLEDGWSGWNEAHA